MRGRRIYGGPRHVNYPSQTIQIESKWKIQKGHVWVWVSPGAATRWCEGHVGVQRRLKQLLVCVCFHWFEAATAAQMCLNVALSSEQTEQWRKKWSGQVAKNKWYRLHFTMELRGSDKGGGAFAEMKGCKWSVGVKRFLNITTICWTSDSCALLGKTMRNMVCDQIINIFRFLNGINFTGPNISLNRAH